jgi:hypothetical protein
MSLRMPFRKATLATLTVFRAFIVGFIPLIGVLITPWILETKGQVLAD